VGRSGSPDVLVRLEELMYVLRRARRVLEQLREHVDILDRLACAGAIVWQARVCLWSRNSERDSTGVVVQVASRSHPGASHARSSNAAAARDRARPISLVSLPAANRLALSVVRYPG
jgi:hypothetical protein